MSGEPLCVVCDDHLRDLLQKILNGQMLPLGYLDENDVYRHLSESKIREVLNIESRSE